MCGRVRDLQDPTNVFQDVLTETTHFCAPHLQSLTGTPQDVRESIFVHMSCHTLTPLQGTHVAVTYKHPPDTLGVVFSLHQEEGRRLGSPVVYRVYHDATPRRFSQNPGTKVLIVLPYLRQHYHGDK